MTSDPRERRAREVAKHYADAWRYNKYPELEDAFYAALLAHGLAERRAGMEEVAKVALERVGLRSNSDYGMGQQDMANEIYEAIRALAAGKEPS